VAEPPESEGSRPNRRAVSPEIREMGERIAAARTKAGLSQSDLARMCEVSQSHISQLEKGTWGPKVNTVMLIATALGVDVRELLPTSEITGEDKG
jgi:transcriptional regulator with XRE-family HTH domain